MHNRPDMSNDRLQRACGTLLGHGARRELEDDLWGHLEPRQLPTGTGVARAARSWRKRCWDPVNSRTGFSTGN